MYIYFHARDLLLTKILVIMIVMLYNNSFNVTLIVYTVKHLISFQKLKEKNIRRPYSMSNEGSFPKDKAAVLAIS
jgi:hypothetical protein